MHYYAETVISDVRRSTVVDGRSGFLRIKPDAEPERAISYLTEERDAAQASVDSFFGPPQLNNVSTQMQALILTELLITESGKSVDLYAVIKAQSYASGRVSESIETVVSDLVMFARQTLEVVGQL